MWWRWVRWVLVGVVAASWVPSLLNPRLAWLWMGASGVLVVTIGTIELVAPVAFLAWRRAWLSQAPQWEQRWALWFDRGVSPRVVTVRIVGATAVVFGIVMLGFATSAFVRWWG